MKLQIFAVRDSKSGQFGTPMFMQSVGIVLRSLGDEVNKGGDNSIISQHPEDFELFHLGEWDTDSSRFDLFPDPKTLVLCGSLKINGSGAHAVRQ